MDWFVAQLSRQQAAGTGEVGGAAAAQQAPASSLPGQPPDAVADVTPPAADLWRLEKIGKSYEYYYPVLWKKSCQNCHVSLTVGAALAHEMAGMGGPNLPIEVVKVVDLSEGPYTERELMLIKVRAVGKEREEMKRMSDIFRGRIIDVTDKTYTIELTGDASKLDAFIEAIDRSAILETVRTGASGIGRGERILRV